MRPRSGHTRHLLAAFSLAVVVGTPRGARAGQTPGDTTIIMEVLGADIYNFRAPSSLDIWTATNAVVIVNDADVTVFDSNTRPRTARQVIAAIRRLTDKPVRTLINSHWHMDHWSGNDEYVKAFPGVQVIATSTTRDFMKRMGAPFFTNGLNGGKSQRAALDTAARTGKFPDGTPATPEARQAMEKEMRESIAFAAEVASTPRVLPTLAFRDTLTFWSGKREFRLISVTGDATGSAVLYMPNERVLVMGDVLVSPEDGNGPPPWTTNNFAITPWMLSLRGLAALDAKVVVPGQGPAFRDNAYLRLTADFYADLIAQVHAALERGLVTTAEVVATLKLDAYGARYGTPGGAPTVDTFQSLVTRLARKVIQESFDGVSK